MLCAPSMTQQSCCKTMVSNHPEYLLQAAPQIRQARFITMALNDLISTPLQEGSPTVTPYGHAPPGVVPVPIVPLRV
jgi:hypothetical protein